MLGVRRVAAREDQAPHRAPHARLHAVDLVEGSVRIVGALDEQRRGGDVPGLGFRFADAKRGLTELLAAVRSFVG